MQTNTTPPTTQALTNQAQNQAQPQVVVVEKEHAHRPHRVTADEKFERHRPDPDIVSTLRWNGLRALVGLITGFIIGGTVSSFTLLSIIVSVLVGGAFTLVQWVRLNSLKDPSNRFLVMVELLTVLISADIGAHFDTLVHLIRWLGGL